MPSKNKWKLGDAPETERFCEACNKTVDFGSRGITNWEVHLAGVAHKRKVKQEKVNNSMGRITSFFTTPRTSQAASGIPLPGPSKVRLDEGNVALSGTPQNEPYNPTADNMPSPRPADALTRLCQLSVALPQSVALGTAEDVLATFSSRPFFVEDGEYDSEFEYVDRTLNVLIGYNIPIDKIAEHIRRGPFGIDGLINWLGECLTWPGVTPELLEGKIDRLCSALIFRGAIVSMYPTYGETAEFDKPLPGQPHLGVAENAVARQESMKQASCSGYKLDIPPDQPPFGAYPNLLHIEHRLPWNVLFRDDGVFLISRSCEATIEHRSGTSPQPCKPCAGLCLHPLVPGIERRAHNGTSENAQWEYHSPSSMRVLLHRKNAQIDSLRLKSLNTSKALVIRGRALDAHKRFVIAVGSSDIHNRVHKIVSIARRNHVGIHTIVARINDAINRTYSTKSYDENEYKRAFVILKLGGQRLANFAHRAFGAPSLTGVRRHFPSRFLRASPGMPTADEMDHNLSAYRLPPAGAGCPILGLVLQIDETKLEKRLRWDSNTNMILGVCREHGTKCSLEFCSMAEADVLAGLLHKGDVHLATEVTVVAVSALSSDRHEYTAYPFIVSGTCKAEDSIVHRQFLDSALSAIERKCQGMSARAYCIASDGEARRGKSLASMTLIMELPAESALYPMLSSLRFFNRLVGKDELTCDKDWLHVAIKRFRNTLVRKSGCSIDGCNFNRPIIKRHLMEGGMSGRTADVLLSPNDPQDVVLAYRLLVAVARLPPAPESSRPIYKETRRVLQLLGRIYNHILQTYANLHATLSEQLIHLSATAHLVLALYRKDKGSFIPAILYLDLMIMIKNVYFCVAKMKRDNPGGSFWVILLGTDGLEKLFGIIRTMVGNDTNADQLQVANRASSAAQVSLILAEHPEWDEGPRRFQMKPLEEQGDDISSKVDHLNPASWVGNVEVRHAVLQTCWIQGCQQAEQELKDADIDLLFDELALEPTAYPLDILRPFGDGKIVYINGLQQGEVEEEELEAAIVANDVAGIVADTSAESQAATDVLLEPDIEDLAGDEENDSTATLNSLHPLKARSEAWLQIGEDPTNLRHKSSVLRMLPDLKDMGPESTNRLGRICGFTRYLNTGIVMDVDAELGTYCLSIDDPALTLLERNNSLFLAVIRILDIQQDGTSMCSLPAHIINEANIRIKFTVMSLSGVVPTKQNNSVDWEWNGRFEHRGNTTVLEAEGCAIQVIDPQVSQPSQQPSGTSLVSQAHRRETYQFKTPELRAFACDLLSRGLTTWAKAPKTDKFPYRLQSGELCFLTESEGQPEHMHNLYLCPYCPSLPLSINDRRKILEHTGVHILHDPAIDRDGMPCGFCLSTGLTCVVYLEKGRGRQSGYHIDLAKTRCPNKFKFSVSRFSKTSKRQFCTNVPVTCPRCPPKSPAIWKYNFGHHLRTAHRVTDLTPYNSLWKLSDSEVIQMQNLYKNPLNGRIGKRKRNEMKATHHNMKVSQAHRCTMTLRTTHLDGQPALPDSDSAAIPAADAVPDEHHYDSASDETASSDSGLDGIDNDEDDSDAQAKSGLDSKHDALSNGLNDPSPAEQPDVGLPLSEAIDVTTQERPNTPDIHEEEPARLTVEQLEQAASTSDMYCICEGPEEGDMIQCDGPGCGQWFHYGCINMHKAPTGDWFCDEMCRQNAGCVARKPKKRARQRK